MAHLIHQLLELASFYIWGRKSAFILCVIICQYVYTTSALCSKTLVPAMGGKIKDGKDGFIATFFKTCHNRMQCILSEKGLYKLKLLNNNYSLIETNVD